MEEITNQGIETPVEAPPVASDATASETPAAETTPKVVQLTEDALKALLAETVNKTRQQERTAAGRQRAVERQRYEQEVEGRVAQTLAQLREQLPDEAREGVDYLLQSRQRSQTNALIAQRQRTILKEAGLSEEDVTVDPDADAGEWMTQVVKATRAGTLRDLPHLIDQALEKRLAGAQPLSAPRVLTSTPTGAVRSLSTPQAVEQAYINGEFGPTNSRAAAAKYKEHMERLGADPGI